MPCGGIYPVKDSNFCWMCNKSNAKHFCEEWDCYIHAECIVAFLDTDEGKVIFDHKHLIVIDPTHDSKP